MRSQYSSIRAATCWGCEVPPNMSQQLTDRCCHGPCRRKASANPAAPDASAAEARSRYTALMSSKSILVSWRRFRT